MATNELLSYPLHDRHRISKVLSSKGSLQYTDKNRNDLCIMTFVIHCKTICKSKRLKTTYVSLIRNCLKWNIYAMEYYAAIKKNEDLYRWQWSALHINEVQELDAEQHANMPTFIKEWRGEYKWL